MQIFFFNSIVGMFVSRQRLNDCDRKCDSKNRPNWESPFEKHSWKKMCICLSFQAFMEPLEPYIFPYVQLPCEFGIRGFFVSLSAKPDSKLENFILIVKKKKKKFKRKPPAEKFRINSVNISGLHGACEEIFILIFPVVLSRKSFFLQKWKKKKLDCLFIFRNRVINEFLFEFFSHSRESWGFIQKLQTKRRDDVSPTLV